MNSMKTFYGKYTALLLGIGLFYAGCSDGDGLIRSELNFEEMYRMEAGKDSLYVECDITHPDLEELLVLPRCGTWKIQKADTNTRVGSPTGNDRAPALKRHDTSCVRTTLFLLGKT